MSDNVLLPSNIWYTIRYVIPWWNQDSVFMYNKMVATDSIDIVDDEVFYFCVDRFCDDYIMFDDVNRMCGCLDAFN